MIQDLLYRRLEPVAARGRSLRLRIALSIVWLLAAAAGAALLGRGSGNASWMLPLLGGAALLAALVCWVRIRLSRRDHRQLARRIERRYPELDTALLAAVEQEPRLPGGRLGFLQEAVIRQALAHAREHPWEDAFPVRRMRLALGASWAGFAALSVVFVLWAGRAGRGAGTVPPEHASAAAARVDARYQVEVEPGDTEVERGSSLLVLARFRGAAPPDAAIVHTGGGGAPERLPMAKSLDDPLFGGRIPTVSADLTYSVEFAGTRTRDYRVTVFEHPELERADARLVFPAYTGLEPATVEDARTLTAVAGTAVTLTCRLTKPVAAARLLGGEGGNLELAPAAGPEDEAVKEGRVYQAGLTLTATRRFQLELVDAAGRKNKEPVEFAFNVTTNRPPDLKLVFPGRDGVVSALEELTVKAQVWDDFGLGQHGLTYNLGGKTTEVVFGASAPGKQRREVTHLIDLEALGAAPDQLLSYHLWADDTGPDGAPRRTAGDIYFAEVRPFEEVFRQGEEPPGGAGEERQPGEGQGAGAGAEGAADLAEMEKEIISATWNLIRRETDRVPTPEFAADSALVAEAQEEALAQAEALGELVANPESKEHVEAVRRHMGTAAERLAEAAETLTPETLRPALAAEQAAYEALLKLQAREHEVYRGNRRQRGQRGQRGGAASRRSERQLEELELTNSENRYETERSSPRQEEAAERENRQVLNRLRELARRQGDLNQRMNELQSALAEARSQEEREEIRRELKRLRDEEERILRDTDELRDRMERPENQRQMADSRRELDETRSGVQRAAEALAEGELGQAASAGTRAAREFEELGEEFRRRSAGRFAEEMREMRRDAQELERGQEDIAERLARRDAPERKSLRGSTERQRLEEDFKRQEEQLGDLFERMEETTREAEASEPLLTRRLYDTLRRARQGKVDGALETARRLIERGLTEAAGAEEERARRGIGELRAGIERAAESVLGDEAEALRQARRQLEELEEDLDREVAAAGDPAPEPQGEGETGAGRAGSVASRPPEAGEPGRPGEPREAAREARPGQESKEAQPGTEAPTGPRGAADGAGSEDAPAREGGGGGQRQLRGPRPEGERAGDREDRGGLALEGGDGREPRRGRRLAAPLTGEGFREWSDRLRDVEEMLDDPALRAEATRIRDRASAVRAEFKRDFKQPDWELVRLSIFQPLVELRERIGEELERREARDAPVPLDRDPVPEKYAEAVRRYYERLGKGR